MASVYERHNGNRSAEQVMFTIPESAQVRTESRGAQYREDHPQWDPEWLKNVMAHLRPTG